MADTYNLQEVCDLLAYSPSTVRRKIDTKEIPQPLKRNGQGALKWRKADIDKFLKRNQPQADTQSDPLSNAIVTLVNEALDQRLRDLGVI